MKSLLALLSLLGVAAGCSDRRLYPPALDIPGAAKQAIATYDTNGDNAIEGAELDRSPALKSALERIDANHDGRITAEELEARFKLWRDSKLALTTCQCSFWLDGEPLEGATITLVPEAFLGPAIKPARGVTNLNGVAILVVDDAEIAAKRLSGVRVGLYTVRVSKKDGEKETIPEHFNLHSILGQEVAHDVDDDDEPNFRFRLESTLSERG